MAAVLLALAVAALTPALLSSSAGAAIVAPVPLGTAAGYSVLAGTTVTNTGPSVLSGSLGVFPGTAVVGFPPGVVLAPSTIQAGTAAAATAQGALTTAYDNAAGRPLNATVPADLAGLTLVGGVYAADANGPLGLTGTVTLDGANDPSSVFVFKTGSTLITGTNSRVALINGAQPCNVFWQVGSSATLGVGTTFRGNVLALTSITVETGATVEGRALARNGAVTLDSNVFTQPRCDLTATTSSTVAPSSTTTSTVAPSSTTTASTVAGASTTTSSTPATTVAPPTTVAGAGTTLAPTTTVAGAGVPTTDGPRSGPLVGSAPQPGPRTGFLGAGLGTATNLRGGQPARPVTELPRTGEPMTGWLVVGMTTLLGGVVLLRLRDRVARRPLG